MPVEDAILITATWYCLAQWLHLLFVVLNWLKFRKLDHEFEIRLVLRDENLKTTVYMDMSVKHRSVNYIDLR